MPEKYDIAIAGGGLVGNSLANALASINKVTNFRIALIDQQPLPSRTFEATRPNEDGRSIALALASKKMLSALGLWQALEENAVPIKKIHISDQGRFGATRLDSQRYEVESFGYLVPADSLIQVLDSQINALKQVTRIQPYTITDIENNVDGVVLYGNEDEDRDPIQAKLLIAADGAQSFIRNRLGITAEEKNYQQSAIVGCIDTEKSHQFTAYERFTEDGPLALLPRNGKRCGFIWMNPTEVSEINMTINDQAFTDKLQQAFGFRLGKFTNISKRFAYPLSLLVSEQRVQQRTVLIGNAAQTLHPVAGQGLNLALRDIAELVELLSKDEKLHDIDAELHRYQAKRQADIENTIRFTDRLNFLFTADYPILSRSRGIGLAMLGAIPALEERIVKQNLGQLGSNANLLRGNVVNS